MDENFGLLLGGSGICGYVKGGDELLVINCNQGAAAQEFRSWVDEKAVRGTETVILSSWAEDFSAGLIHFSEAKRVLAAAPMPPGLRGVLSESLARRVEVVREESVIDIGDERVRIVPVGNASTGSDLVVFLEKRAVLFTGALFFNRLHPVIRAGVDAQDWITKLQKVANRFSPRIVVPAEGDLANSADVVLFLSYLRDLTNTAVEFSTCRERYDWPEIPNTTSLEENFDLLRARRKTHTSLG